MSVRELAAEAEVNPNTMQKALSELERDGLLYTQRTSGRFITNDKEAISNLRKQLAEEQLGMFLNNMAQLGYSPDESVELLKKHTEKAGKD